MSLLTIMPHGLGRVPVNKLPQFRLPLKDLEIIISIEAPMVGTYIIDYASSVHIVDLHISRVYFPG